MSTLAGYDLVTEISNSKILEFIKANCSIQDIRLNPPFEISVPVAYGIFSGLGTIICEDLDLDFISADRMNLILSFDQSSLVVNTPDVSFCPLDGTMEMETTLMLDTNTSGQTQLFIDYVSSDIRVVFSPESESIIVDRLTGYPITPDQFKEGVINGLTEYIRSLGTQAVALTFQVVPGEDGSMNPMKFEKLDLKLITNEDRNRQALCLLGILYAANHSNGRLANKTSTSILSENNVSLSISEQCFQKEIFCPSLSSALRAIIPRLPKPCGDGSIPYRTAGVTIKTLTQKFSNANVIEINGTVYKSGTCYEANGAFHGTLTLEMEYSSIKPTFTLDAFTIDVDIEWYCYLAAAIVLGPLILLFSGLIEQAASLIARSLALDMLQGFLGDDFNAISLEDISEAHFNAISITREVLTLNGTAPELDLPYPGLKSVRIEGSVITTDRTEVSSGIYRSENVVCATGKEYPYTEYLQQQQGVYYYHTYRLTPPVVPKFEIHVVTYGEDGRTDKYPLEGNSGTVSFIGKSDYPMPLPGGTTIEHEIRLDYEISGNTVLLTSRPEDGIYKIYLYGEFTDCSGNYRVARESVTLFGHIVEFSSDYYVDQQACWASIQEKFKQKTFQGRFIDVPPDLIGPINYPAEQRMAETIYRLVSMDIEEADHILAEMKMAHGTSYFRGLYSEAHFSPEV